LWHVSGRFLSSTWRGSNRRADWESIYLRPSGLSSSPICPGERQKAMWLSHRDLAQVVGKSLQAPVGFGIYNAVSNIGIACGI
jgi:hypothetical protein